MAKWKRRTIGSVVKSKEAGEPDYIKIGDDVVLKKGDTLRLESKAAQLRNLEEGVQAGRLGEETASKIRERLDRFPEWVRFEIVQLTKQQ